MGKVMRRVHCEKGRTNKHKRRVQNDNPLAISLPPRHLSDMGRTADYSRQSCSIAATLEVIGEFEVESPVGESAEIVDAAVVVSLTAPF